MSDSREQRIGKVEWFDLTVEDAEANAKFYENVVGWKATPLQVADYHDFCVGPNAENVVAGICHARGPNAEIPSVWMVYINVDDLDQSLDRVAQLGGKQMSEIRSMEGSGRYCMIQDPAGAVCSLFEPVRDA